MLFTYSQVSNHPLSRVHGIIESLFFDVWCKAPSNEYDISLFSSNSYLFEIMEELHRRDSAGILNKKGSDYWFYELVNEIYIDFKTLSTNQILEYQRYFNTNNSVGSLCNDSCIDQPVHYDDLDANLTVLNKKLENFYSKLYSGGFLNLAFVKKIIGTDVNSYYQDFVRQNNQGVCPFCGLLPIDNEYDPTRDAFDHFLPKSLYPFNSVCLDNLAPSCDKCNSKNKRDKDPIYDSNKTRRKTFYPFSVNAPDVQVNVEVLDSDLSKIEPNKLKIELESTINKDEVETWDELFRIKQRYAARCCADEGGGYFWINRIISESQNYQLSKGDMLSAELTCADNSPWADTNFLKGAFLQGCDDVGMFD